MSGGASAYDTLGPVYDRRWARYLSLSIGLARAHLYANPGETLIDAGCGTGQLLQLVGQQEPGVRAFGVDPSAGMLAVARDRLPGSVRLIRGQAGALPFRTSSADWLVSTSALHHVADPPDALDEWYRVLRPGGRLVLVDWAGDFLAMRALTAWVRRREPGPIHVYTSTQLERLLAKSAFEGIRVRAHRMTWMWGMLVATAERP